MTMAPISSEPFLLCALELACEECAFWFVESWQTDETENPLLLGLGVANREVSTSLSFAKVTYLRQPRVFEHTATRSTGNQAPQHSILAASAALMYAGNLTLVLTALT